MLILNTETVQDKKVKISHGMVVAEVVLTVNVIKDIFANIRDTFGGRSQIYENALMEAREMVTKELEKKAEEMGANGILGVKYNFISLGANGSIFAVNVAGTAVTFEE